MEESRATRKASVPRFGRDFFGANTNIARIGDGELGGKATGLAFADAQLSDPSLRGRFGPYDVRIPRTVVLTTQVFDSFLHRNGLGKLVESDEDDAVVAMAFQRAVLPTEFVGDLRALINGIHVPLAVRSSSLLEDALFRPFAGIYGTKMTPNNQADPDERFRKFVEAIKFVYASTFFRAAKAYARAAGQSIADEKMAVLVQEVVGSRRGDRFYPVVSAVARSYNFYASDASKPEDGVVSLALGLGKTIVDGGACWTYPPSAPKTPPPFGSNKDLLRYSQNRFWAVGMGRPPAFDPLRETEYLTEQGLPEAELDGVLGDVASTYDPNSDRLTIGTGRPGPRVVDFGPLLRLGESPFSSAVRELLAVCREAEGIDVELEIAADWTTSSAAPTLSLLQVRSMVVADGDVELSPADLRGPETLLASERAVGHGTELIEDVVYVRPEAFDPAATVQIALEIGARNRVLGDDGRPYLLIGFGRWGTTDPWGGIPVRWEQVDGARAIVEVSMPDFRAAPSQGSHFFHNVTSLQVLYLASDESEADRIRWDWLSDATQVETTQYVRHVRFRRPLAVEVDGKSRRGRVRKIPHSSAMYPIRSKTMNVPDPPIESILHDLRERAKELNCLYRVDEILHVPDLTVDERMQRIVEAIPAGWQYSEDCTARLVLGASTYQVDGFEESSWFQEADIVVEGVPEGLIAVFYTQRRPHADRGPFLEEEYRLINAISERIGHFLSQERLRSAVASWETAVVGSSAAPESRWKVIVDFLRNADEKLLLRITRRMINHLCWSGLPGSEALLRSLDPSSGTSDRESGDENRPAERVASRDVAQVTEDTFECASRHLSDDEITNCVQRWIREDKTSFLADTLEDPGTSVSEVADALERHRALALDPTGLPAALGMALKVALLRRCFTDDLEFINTAKSFVEVADFYDLLPRVVHPQGSHGRLGGKSAGLFLAASVVRRAGADDPLLSEVRVPKTWYIASDGILEFIRYNHFEDVYVRKYDQIDHVRQGYPYLIQSFKSSPFPPEMRGRLAIALEDFGEKPIIVRSSSLLEDRTGSSFSGKYKSLFLANQGSPGERLAALEDAIAEVYASTFGPDPIGYRAERGLIDVHEEMGIMIQEVVGTRVGRYFLPAFAGVAFSNNEFRWSPRIKREDGLVRLVPGLGTRAVDRLSDDYPILVAPGQPGLRVNASPDEVIRYAPRKVDVIDLEMNRFETIDVKKLMRTAGSDYPGIRKLISLVEGDQLRKPLGLMPDLESQDFVVTFEGLATDTPFLAQIRALLGLLQKEMQTPVDIEFASDGENFYLLQCRPQSYSRASAPAPIPKDLPRSDLLFSANRFVSNGRGPDITHIVYVDPLKYSQLETLTRLHDVGTVVRKLNKILPKRQFILMGPGRWGSRGDIKLGVNVTYSDINNTAVLVEIARTRGNYVPDLSFGTHFFQDLVESGIRYLPLYPDEAENVFDERFFTGTRNLLSELLPEHGDLDETVRVIDVPNATKGRVLRILMNADLDEAVGILADPSGIPARPVSDLEVVEAYVPQGDDWRWRARMAERLAAELDPERFGVEGIYLFGSAKNGTSGPGSDIDLIVHIRGSEEQKSDLGLWLEGWSRCLAEINYLRTGYPSQGLLDVHWVTDQDIAERSSFAVKIDAITDRAQRLSVKGDEDRG